MMDDAFSFVERGKEAVRARLASLDALALGTDARIHAAAEALLWHICDELFRATDAQPAVAPGVVSSDTSAQSAPAPSSPKTVIVGINAIAPAPTFSSTSG